MRFVIFHSDYEYYKFLYEKTETSYDVENIYGNTICTNSCLLKALYRIHNSSTINRYINIPFKSIWYRFLVPRSVSKNENVCFIFNSSRVAGINKSFYSYLRKHYRCKLVMQLWNPIDWDQSKGAYVFEDIRGIMDFVCTYNKYDFKKYNVSTYPYILFQLQGITIKPMRERTVDVLFIGQDKGRMSFIEKLYLYLTGQGLICDFYLVNPLEECKTQGIHKSDWISYQQLINKTENTKCIVNILQPGAEGVTIRDVEAYNYGCFMITNNLSTELKDLYNDGQLIDIDHIDDSTIASIKQRNTAFPKRDNNNSLDNFYNWVQGVLGLA